MMFNMPPGTARYTFPPRTLIDPETGKVSAHAFLFELAAIGMRVQALDEAVASGAPPGGELYEQVLSADRELRALAAQMPPGWWTEPSPEPATGSRSAPAENDYNHATELVKFWHCYITARVHLHAAMSVTNNGSSHDQWGPLAYSRSMCIEACASTVRRFRRLRLLSPHGFFVTRIVHMQVFTAITVLLLSRYQDEGRGSSMASMSTGGHDLMGLVSQAIEDLDADSHQVGADFASEAVTAIRSLYALLERPASAPAEQLTLRIPLLGKVLIGRRQEHGSTPGAPTPSAPAHTPWKPASNASGPPPVGTSAISGSSSTATAQSPSGMAGFSPSGDPASFLAPPPVPPAMPNTNAMPLPPAAQPQFLPWLLELDVASAMDDPFLMDGLSDLEPWPAMGDNFPVASTAYDDLPS